MQDELFPGLDDNRLCWLPQDNGRMIQSGTSVYTEDGDFTKGRAAPCISAGDDRIIRTLKLRHPCDQPAARLDDLLNPGAVLIVGHTIEGQSPGEPVHIGPV